MTIAQLVSAQRIYFNSGATRSAGFRTEQLNKFEQVIRNHEQLLLDAIYADLKKSAELGTRVRDELNTALREIRKT